jgi:hypothetical protein
VRPPVVLLILDEFPVDTLTRPGGQIDADRYPGFAALARTSTWFRGGHAVYDSTTKAVPAILDGRSPRAGSAPGYAGHPNSIFTLLAGLGYDVVADESVSPLCPPAVCPDEAESKHDVLAELREAQRPVRLRGWIDSIRPRERPTLYVHHALLPHEPWIYLPSGRPVRPPGIDPIGAINRPNGFGNRDLTDHNELRHLLQVGFVDREVGALVRHLRQVRLLRRALVIVVADHGYAFEVGVKDRRKVTASNVAQIAPVPFFVKVPGQERGRVSDALVANFDVVPTVADVLGVRVPWRHESRSAFSEARDDVPGIRIPTRDFGDVIEIDRDELERRRALIRLERAQRYGTGLESRLFLGDPWASAYRIGPHPELIGRAVPREGSGAPSGLRAAPANAGLLADVSSTAPVFPSRFTGQIEGGGRGTDRGLAVAVNGRIWAVGRSFHLEDQRPEYFSLLVPDRALHAGHNKAELFEVQHGELLSLGRW